MGEVSPPLRIGIDTGGTFTDFVVYNPADGSLETFKAPSTPANPALAVIRGIRKVFELHPDQSFQVIHGSTVATNALLERKGARTALLTTEGFGDVLEIGRQNRPDLYDLSPKMLEPLVPSAMRLELVERIGPDGTVLRALDRAALPALPGALAALGEIESVAVCLLFSFANPVHEAAAAESLRRAGYTVSVSSEILPEFREYERMATTVVNAYVSPIFDRYLGELEDVFAGDYTGLAPSRFSIMQSNGGTISPGQARREAVRCILSGPAGGLIAARHLAGSAGCKLLTIDMGGTSTDVSLIIGEPQLAVDAEIGGLPIRVPVLDIHTIGAGGGSIASLDPACGLRVGPESAGADPGPACYARTPHPEHATVTDANLLLGRLVPDRFLGGTMPLDPARARAAIAPLAEGLGRKPVDVAAGILRIANAHMARALRVISVERGHDPAAFALVSFGGAGGLHAADLARELGIPKVILPEHAAAFSALGMLQADVVKDYVRTVMLSGETRYETLQEAFQSLFSQAAVDLAGEGISEDDRRMEASLDVRFRGQSYDLSVPFTEGWQSEFIGLYRETYGFAPESGALEIVNLRLQARGALPLPEIRPQVESGPSTDAAFVDKREIWDGETMRTVPVFAGEKLRPGNRLTGPALVVRADTTIWIGPADRARVDPYGSLVIHVAPVEGRSR